MGDEKRQALYDASADADTTFKSGNVAAFQDPCPCDILVDFAPLPETGLPADPSPFLRQEDISVLVFGGGATARGAKVGANQLLYSAAVPAKPGDTIALQIHLPPLLPSGPSPLVIQQMFIVEQNLGLRPVLGSDNKSKTTYRKHPRIRKWELRSGMLPRVWVDITFIEVTDVVRGQGLLEDYDRPWGGMDGVPSQEPSAHAAGNVPAEKAEHHNCELHVYELTMGKPRAWSVVVPKAARKSKAECNVLVFYQPTLEMTTYTTSTNCTGYYPPNLPRYTRDPSFKGPFYYRTQHGSKDAAIFFNTGSWPKGGLTKGEDVNSMHTRYDRYPYPYTGFEGQLDASQKPVVMAMPYPHGDNTDYGVATSRNLKALIESLVTALATGGALSEEKAGLENVSLGRLGVSGFSSGGGAALAALWGNTKVVSEMYLFDHYFGVKAESFKEFLAKADNRLCLVAGRGIERAIKLKENLPGPNVFLTPNDRAFFDTPGNTWHAAIFPPASAGHWEAGPQTLSDQGSASPTLLSTSSQVVVQKPDPLTLGIASGATNNTEFGRVEAAGLVRLWQIARARGEIEEKNDAPPGTFLPPYTYRPVKTQQDLNEVTLGPNVGSIKVGNGVMWDMRHQWAVQGGIGAVSRYPYGEQDQDNPDGKAFEGYLHFCLKHSGFA